MADAASQIGRSKKKALAWRGEVGTALETLLVDPAPELQRFSELTASVLDGKDISEAVRKGAQYLRDIGSMHGGRLK